MKGTKIPKCEIPTFITKLLSILNLDSNKQIISWDQFGQIFMIHNVSKFVEDILPVYYKHRNFSSFIRQLNMYGFAKTKDDNLENAYIHPHFKKYNNDLLIKIKRKQEHKRQIIPLLTNPLEKQLKLMKVRQDQVQISLQNVLNQNHRLTQLYQALSSKIQTNQRQLYLNRFVRSYNLNKQINNSQIQQYNNHTHQYPIQNKLLSHKDSDQKNSIEEFPDYLGGNQQQFQYKKMKIKQEYQSCNEYDNCFDSKASSKKLQNSRRLKNQYRYIKENPNQLEIEQLLNFKQEQFLQQNQVNQNKSYIKDQ